MPAQHRRTSRAVVLALSEGFTATVVVLAERAGIRVDRERLGAAPDGPREDVQVSAAGMAAPPPGRGRSTGPRRRRGSSFGAVSRGGPGGRGGSRGSSGP
ncbi:DUF6086 family protein [Streptomyces virginiae]|uniref:DUF6086 family protein n=1 Tax=Streptomyces virginiae TaxID=1961 RepID=UPI003D802081